MKYTPIYHWSKIIGWLPIRPINARKKAQERDAMIHTCDRQGRVVINHHNEAAKFACIENKKKKCVPEYFFINFNISILLFKKSTKSTKTSTIQWKKKRYKNTTEQTKKELYEEKETRKIVGKKERKNGERKKER